MDATEPISERKVSLLAVCQMVQGRNASEKIVSKKIKKEGERENFEKNVDGCVYLPPTHKKREDILIFLQRSPQSTIFLLLFLFFKKCFCARILYI